MATLDELRNGVTSQLRLTLVAAIRKAVSESATLPMIVEIPRWAMDEIKKINLIMSRDELIQGVKRALE